MSISRPREDDGGEETVRRCRKGDMPTPAFQQYVWQQLPLGGKDSLNPNAFVSTVDPSAGACVGGDTPSGDSSRRMIAFQATLEFRSTRRLFSAYC